MQRNFKDETGNTYGYLTVIEYAYRRVQPSGQTKTMWRCKCACGHECIVDAYALRSGNTKSCKYCKQTCRDHSIKDITGNTYGKLKVTRLNRRQNKKTYWDCICECGRNIVVPKSNLLNGNTKSCGCIYSIGECKIQDYLISNNIDFQREYKFEDLIGNGGGCLSFDFAIFNNGKLKCLIQYQGKQHYVDFGAFGKQQRQITDALKKQYCKINNIQLFEIRYDEQVQLKLNELFSSQDNTVPSSNEKV